MSEKATILIVDDNPMNIDVLVDLLNDYDLLVSLNAQDALDLLDEQEVDLILLDIMMPGMDGMEMAQQLTGRTKNSKVPFLFITAKQDDESIEAGFDAGASDYITKPFRPRELRARVKTHLQMHALMKELAYTANFDYLSGARNRRSFFEEVKRFYDPLHLDKELYAVMIDIDKFKGINDTYGHAVGDSVIRALSETIRTHVQEGMLFARMGGEEFVVMSNGLEKTVLLGWVEGLREAVETARVPVEDETLQFTISCGIAQRSREHKTIDLLLDEADKALYDAKEQGRNRVIFRV